MRSAHAAAAGARRAACLLLAVTLISCSRSPTPAPAGEPAPRVASAPTDPDALCAEHGVLEVICTKCNPALIPVFQARGDWCPEHGFPESVCPICHPERGGRPAVDVSSEDGPKSGTRITFKSRESAELAGIDTAVAASAPAGSGLAVLGRIVPDGSRIARVNPRVEGVLREVLADIGTTVAVGSPLAEIESAELGAAQAHRRSAEARVRTARSQAAREHELLAERITSAQQAQIAQGELEEAEADLAAARSELGVVGNVTGAGRYRLVSPIAGVVTERQASAGQLVHTEDTLFVVIDPSVVRVELDVPESAIGALHQGLAVTVQSDALPGRTYEGVLEYIAPTVDAASRTVKARVTLANADGSLRANMLVRARIASLDGASATAVPAEAIHDIEGVSMVFVQLAPDKFETRKVQSGPREGDVVSVLSGLEPGEVVATGGSFLLETELLKSSIGAGCCEVE